MALMSWIVHILRSNTSTCVSAVSKKTKLTITIKLPKRRNHLAVHAFNRKAGPMHDRRAPRGGAKDKQKEILKDYENDDE